MVVQNDGSIILCDNDSELARRPRIEVVEILSPTNYVRGKEINEKKNTNSKLNFFAKFSRFY